jgi:hypothetical protein
MRNYVSDYCRHNGCPAPDFQSWFFAYLLALFVAGAFVRATELMVGAARLEKIQPAYSLAALVAAVYPCWYAVQFVLN